MVSDRSNRIDVGGQPGGEAKGGSAPELLGRRLFTKGAAGILAATFVSGAYASPAGGVSNDLGEKPDDLSAAEWDEIQSRYHNLVRVYGARLNPEQRHTLGNVLIQNERMLSSIRRFVTHNNDPAALTLRLAIPQTLP